MNWSTGFPEKSGVYIVAILYDDGTGTIYADSYNPIHGWTLDDNIIAYIPLREVLNAANVEWPEHLTPSD
jgi:hypothetical protein